MARKKALVALVGLIGGCDATCPRGAPTITLGSGQFAFEALAEGDPLPFYLGPQGGYHVFTSVEASSLALGENIADLENPWLTVRLTVDDEIVAQMDRLPRFFQGTVDESASIGNLVVFTHATPTSFDGSDATLEVTVEDRCERAVTEAVGVELTLAQ